MFRKCIAFICMFFMCSVFVSSEAVYAKETWTVFGYGENNQVWVKNRIGEQILCKPTVFNATVGMQVFISGKTIIIGNANLILNKWIIVTGSDVPGSPNMAITLDEIAQDTELTQTFVGIWKSEITEGLDRYGWLAQWVEYLMKGKKDE